MVKYVKIDIGRWWAFCILECLMFLTVIVVNYDLPVKDLLRTVPGWVVCQLILFTGKSTVTEDGNGKKK